MFVSKQLSAIYHQTSAVQRAPKTSVVISASIPNDIRSSYWSIDESPPSINRARGHSQRVNLIHPVFCSLCTIIANLGGLRYMDCQHTQPEATVLSLSRTNHWQLFCSSRLFLGPVVHQQRKGSYQHLSALIMHTGIPPVMGPLYSLYSNAFHTCNQRQAFIAAIALLNSFVIMYEAYVTYAMDKNM